MQVVRFEPAGGRIKASVSSGFAQPGSYTLLLWSSGTNDIVQEEHGNFMNDDDDSYPLPTPVAGNDGRIVEALVTVVLTPPLRQYAVTLTVEQDGVVLGREKREGRGKDFETITSDLYVRLSAS